jgi:hypothetical protein
VCHKNHLFEDSAKGRGLVIRFRYLWPSRTFSDSTAAYNLVGDLPYSVPKLSKVLLVFNVNFTPCSWLYEDPDLIAPTAEDDGAVYVGIGADDAFHGSWYCLLPRREYQNVIDPSYAARKMSEKINNINFNRTSSTNPLSSGA